MQQFISWKLLSNNEIIMFENDTLCEYENKILKFKDKYGNNEINLNEKYYKRSTSDWKMIINFSKKIAIFKLNEKQEYSTKIKASLNLENNLIICKYNIDGEEKSLIITRKERKNEK